MPTGCTFNPCVASLKIQIIQLKKKRPKNAIQIHIRYWKQKLKGHALYTLMKYCHSIHQTFIKSSYGSETILTSMTMIY